MLPMHYTWAGNPPGRRGTSGICGSDHCSSELTWLSILGFARAFNEMIVLCGHLTIVSEPGDRKRQGTKQELCNSQLLHIKELSSFKTSLCVVSSLICRPTNLFYRYL